MSAEDLVREAQDPATSAARLQELAQLDRATWVAIAANPTAYDGLLTWLGEHGDDAVRSAIAGRGAATSPAAVAPEAPAAPAEPEAVPVPATQDVEATQPVPTVSTGDPEATQPVEPVSNDTTQIPVEHTTQLPVTPAAPAAETVSFGSVPPGGVPPEAADGGSGSSKKNIFILAGIAAAVLVLVGGIAFAATSGGDDDTPDKTTSASSDKTDEAPDASDTPDAGDTPEASEVPDSSGGDGDKGDFCDDMKEIQDSSLANLPSAGSAPDLGDIQDSFKEMQDSYDDLQDSAPAELKKDVAVMAKFIDNIVDASAGDPSAMTDNMDGYIAAAQRVTTYYYSNCL